MALWRNLDRLTRYYGPLAPGRLARFPGKALPHNPKLKEGVCAPVIVCIGPAGRVRSFDDLEDQVNDSQ